MLSMIAKCSSKYTTYCIVIFLSIAISTVSAANDESFNDALQKENAQQHSPHGKQTMGEIQSMSSGGSVGAMVPFSEMSIDKVDAENGYTVDEVFTEAKTLDGKMIQVRGKVLKFSPMIMGRNWIHIQDGTGDPMQNHHDLVVTSKATVSPGVTVIIAGKVAADKDFGAGYRYEVLVEDAKITEEK